MNLIMACIIFAKLVDIHIGNEAEFQEIERGQQQKERERAMEIINDPRYSDEIKSEAFETVIRDMS